MRHNGGMCLQLTNSPALNPLRVAASSNPAFQRTFAKMPTKPAELYYKGFPTFVKQKSIVVNRAAIDHET